MIIFDPPVASYTWRSTYPHTITEVESIEAPATIEFTDTSTGPPACWLWDFADGWSSTLQNPSHTFTQPGTYTITLEVTNSEGSDQVAHQITIREPDRPYAGFSAEPTSGASPLTVQFTDESTEEITTNWLWEFGDGLKSYTQHPAHTYIAPGTYTVILTASNRQGADTITKTDYITVGSGLASSAIICGLVYDLTDLSTIDDAQVTISNATWSDTTVTVGGGYYQFGNLTPGIYTVQGAKPGYAGSPSYAVQAYSDTVIPQNVALAVSGVTLSGICYDAEAGVPLENTVVTAKQGTTTVTATTGPDGKYALDNFLLSSDISISATHTGYNHFPITVTPKSEGALTRDLYLLSDNLAHSGTAIAGLVLSDEDDQAIQGATVTATSSGTTDRTTLTSATAYYLIDNLPAAQWGVSATATDYEPSLTYTHTLTEGNVTIQLIKLKPADNATSSIIYSPKQVRFTFLSGKTGAPIPDLTVFATGTATTAGTWDWFKSLLGIDVSKTNLNTATMNGVTGADGSIAFMMLESVYYSINVSNPDLGIAMATNLYPKEDEYVITVWADPPASTSRVTWEFSDEATNETHTRLDLSYLDAGNRTKTFEFTVQDEDHTLIHRETIADQNDIGVSYTLENVPGKAIIWGFKATLNAPGGGDDEIIQESQFIRFGENTHTDLGIPTEIKHWAGFFFLVCLAGAVGFSFHGPNTLKFVGPIIGIFTMFMKFIDMLPIGWELAIIIFILGCLGYIRLTKDEKQV